MVLGFKKIHGNLKIHPEFRGCLKNPSQQNSCFGSDIPLSVYESVHALDRDAHSLGQMNLA
jgi:hypothetical protein